MLRRPAFFVLVIAASLFAAFLLAAGCGGSSDCVEGLSLECAPLYEPTFDQVFAKTLLPTCAQAGSSCHASTGKQGGLSFEDADASYQLLIDRALVLPGDAACSPLIERIAANDPEKLMPPGRALSDAERCSIVRWIADGAKR